MHRNYPGWVSLPNAAKSLDVHYEVLRRMVEAAIFTRGCFSHSKKRPPIYLRSAEVEAFRTGGVDAVQLLRSPKATKSRVVKGTRRKPGA